MKKLSLFILFFCLNSFVYALDVPTHTASKAANALEEANRLYPGNFEYLGAFRFPLSNDGTFSYGGIGACFYPDGDSQGAIDGFPGSVFSLTHTYTAQAGEFNIPVPVISAEKNVNELNRAELLQVLADVAPGYNLHDNYEVRDIQYYPRQDSQLTDKLYWSMYIYYMPHDNMFNHGWCELDLSAVNSQGPWAVNVPGARTGEYMFDIPKGWADNYADGHYLSIGRFRDQGGGGFGPALYAYAPWKGGNPPTDTQELFPLLEYDHDYETSITGFGHNDAWQDGAWLTVGNKSAVIIAGSQAFADDHSAFNYYGAPMLYDIGGKGWHGGPDAPVILFYDPDDLAKVAQGQIQAHEPQPYLRMNLSDFSYNLEAKLGGVAYDRENNLLYLTETFGDGSRPVMHVFQVNETNGSPDVETPSQPTGLTIDSNVAGAITLSWDPSKDNHKVTSYYVFRNGWPCELIGIDDLHFTDTKVSPNTEYVYNVIAVDSSSNRSPYSKGLSVISADGIDTEPPQITEIQVTNITTTSAVITWKTDEPASTELASGYSIDSPDAFYTDPALTKFHQVTLTGLTPNRNYGYRPESTDVFGNEINSPETRVHIDNGFHTLANITGNNEPPTLTGVQDYTVGEGQMVRFLLAKGDLETSGNGVSVSINLNLDAYN